MAADNTNTSTATKGENNKKDGGGSLKRSRESEITPLLMPSLYRLTEGLPRRELKLMVTESKACEEALEKEIQELEEGLKNDNNSNDPNTNNHDTSDAAAVKKSPVDIMLETEVTPPDRYFTVSSLLGRLRDVLATPLPPNSMLPALRAQHGILQPPTKKKKSNNHTNPNNELSSSAAAASAASTTATSPAENKAAAPLSDLEKQKRLLALHSNPEYIKEHPTPIVLLAVWKKVSTHRTSVVFRRPVNPKEAPGYTDRIFFPMDLSLVRKMIVARMIKSYSDLHQRIGLICHNCVKYNGRESDYGIVTRDFEAIVDEFVVAAVAASGSNKTQTTKNPTELQQGDAAAVKTAAKPSAAAPVGAATTKAAPVASTSTSDNNNKNPDTTKQEPETTTKSAKKGISSSTSSKKAAS